jgi:hypothetical protein
MRARTQNQQGGAGAPHKSVTFLRKIHVADVPRTHRKLKSAGGNDFANLLLPVA